MATDNQVQTLLDERALAEVISFETDEVARAAHGSQTGTFDGREYIDFTSGIAVHAVGQTHPAIVEAIVRQAGLFTHTADVTRHLPQLQLAHEIRGLLSAATPSIAECGASSRKGWPPGRSDPATPNCAPSRSSERSTGSHGGSTRMGPQARKRLLTTLRIF